MLKELTVEAIDRIDADYWGKCVDHMMKELEYYMVLDGLTTPIADEIAPPNTFTEEIIESLEEPPTEEVSIDAARTLSTLFPKVALGETGTVSDLAFLRPPQVLEVGNMI